MLQKPFLRGLARSIHVFCRRCFYARRALSERGASLYFDKTETPSKLQGGGRSSLPLSPLLLGLQQGRGQSEQMPSLEPLQMSATSVHTPDSSPPTSLRNNPYFSGLTAQNRVVASRASLPSQVSQNTLGVQLISDSSRLIPRGRPSRRTLKSLEVGRKPFKSWTSPDVVFDQIDKDKSGLVDLMELKRFFRGTLDPGKIDSMFETLDDDGSGEISRDEWRKGYFSAGFGDTTVVGQSSAGLSVLLSLVSKPKKVDFMDLSHHKNGCRINKIAERGITLLQLRDVWAHVSMRCEPEGWMGLDGQLLTASSATLYEVVRYVVKPATKRAANSYVEFVATESQCPLWCVSHWWGMPFKDLLDCLEQHARDRGISEHSAYWISPFAVNQHNGEADSPNILQFVEKTLSFVTGTVTILDRAGVAMRRAWVLYELFLSLRRTDSKWDVYTALPHVCSTTGRVEGTRHRDCTAVGFIDGYAVCDLRDFEANKVSRESYFPLAQVVAALSCRLQDAHASVEGDRRAILNTVAFGQPDSVAPAQKDAVSYDHLNMLVRARFALAAMRAAVDAGSPLFYQGLKVLSLSATEKAVLGFSGCQGFDESKAAELANALPSNLKYLDFSCFQKLGEIRCGDAFVATLSQRVIATEGKQLGNLRQLAIKSDTLTREGAHALGSALSKGLLRRLRSIDMGSPVPIAAETADALTQCVYGSSPPKNLSFCGDRLASSIVMRKKGLTSADLILILASAVTGACGEVTMLDVSDNNIGDSALSHLERVLTLSGSQRMLPSLYTIDLSGNTDMTQGMKQRVLDARRGPMGEDQVTGVRFELSPLHSFRIEARDNSDY